MPLFLPSFLNSYLWDWKVCLCYSCHCWAVWPTLSAHLRALVGGCLSFACPAWEGICSCSEVGYFSVIQTVETVSGSPHLQNQGGSQAGPVDLQERRLRPSPQSRIYNETPPSWIQAPYPYHVLTGYFILPQPPPFFFLGGPCHMACRILVPQSRIEPVPPAVEARSPNHWTTRREVPSHRLLNAPHLFLLITLQPTTRRAEVPLLWFLPYVCTTNAIYLKFFFKSTHHFTENIYLIRKFCYYVNRNPG